MPWCRAFTLGSTYIAEVDIVLPPLMAVAEAHDIGAQCAGSGVNGACVGGSGAAAAAGRRMCKSHFLICYFFSSNWEKCVAQLVSCNRRHAGATWGAGRAARPALMSPPAPCCPSGESLQVKLELLPEVSRACEWAWAVNATELIAV